MIHDVDLLRKLLLGLEDRQVSPRATVVIMIQDEAENLDIDAGTVASGLNMLQELDYIEGPGPDADGFWLFRKLTRKGNDFVRAARDPAAWDKMKRRRAQSPVDA